jgi:hypothetical protein
MKRNLAVLAMVGAVVAAMAWPASAKGEGPVGATITGPGIGGPGGSGPGAPGGPGGGYGSGGGSSDNGTGSAAAVGTIEFVNKAGLDPFQNNPMWRLASFSGLVMNCSTCASYIDTSPPKDMA